MSASTGNCTITAVSVISFLFMDTTSSASIIRMNMRNTKATERISDYPDWLIQVMTILAERPDDDETPELLGQRIHKALEIAEVEKYATPESRFTFTVVDGTEADVAKVRAQLTPFEQSIVEIKRK